MAKIFRRVLQIVGFIMMFIPGGQIWAVLTIAITIGSAAWEVQAQKKQNKKERRAAESQASAQTVMVKQPIMNRRIVYGSTRLGGMWCHVDISDDNKFLYLILALCEGPVEAITDIYFNDELVPFGVDNFSTGKYEGKARIVKHLGALNQTYDTLMEADSTEWTTDHHLKGIAYLAVRLEMDQTLFPHGLPNISALIHGRNTIVDGRDDVAKYTSNPALCWADYMTDQRFGPSSSFANDLDHPTFDAAANICDEQVTLEATATFTIVFATDANQLISVAHGLFNGQIVQFTSTTTLPAGLTLATDYYVIKAFNDSFEVSLTLDGDPVAMTSNGTGVHTFTAKEFRFTFNGFIDLGNNPEDNIRSFAQSMAGVACNVGGLWTVYAGAYQTPINTITTDMLVGPIKIRPRQSMRERFNTVKGLFVTHKTRFQPTDYPPVSNTTYVTDDGGELIQGLDLPATNSPSMASRIAKILLEQSRKEKTLELVCNIQALRVQAGQTVLVNIPRYNINNLPFDVIGYSMIASQKTLEIHLSLKETASTVYSWASGSDEQTFDVADEPTLSDGLPLAPTGLVPTNTVDGRDLTTVVLDWDATTDELILDGGFVVVEWKKSSDSDTEWLSFTGGPTSISYPVIGLVPDINYDFRVAWRNKFSGQSAWTESLNHQTAASSSSAYNYKHTQGVSSAEWVIAHNLGYRPSVGQVFDDSFPDEPIFGTESTGSDSDPTGTMEIKITFNKSFTGTAYLS